MTTTNWALATAAIALISGATANPTHAEGPTGVGGMLEPVMDVLTNEGKGYDLSDSILGPDSAWDFGGWLAAGGSSNSTGLFNSDRGFNITQAWVYVEKSMDTEDGFDWGFRGDLVVGTHAPDTQSFGNNFNVYDFGDATTFGSKYGLAAPQIYVELGFKDFSIKGGKFYTPVGYEVVAAPDNFFYSHAFTMYLSEPFTHTGFLATYSGIENVEVFAGWSAGWDTGFDQFNGGSNFLGGVSFTLIDAATLTYTTTAGNLGWIGDDGYTHSFVLDVDITEKLNYVIQSDYVDVKNAFGVAGDKYETIGVNQYLIYSLNDIVGLGTRVEWWRANKTDYYEVTVGVNLQLLPNLRARPEFRYQFAPGVVQGTSPNVAGLPVNQGIFGIDFIITF